PSFPRPKSVSSQRRIVDLAGADADRMFDRGDENFTIPDEPHRGSPSDGFDDLIGLDVSYNNLDLNLGHNEHRILGATLDLGTTALPPEPLDVGDRHPLDAQSAQGLANFLELEGLDDGGHEFHRPHLVMFPTRTRALGEQWSSARLNSRATLPSPPARM